MNTYSLKSKTLYDIRRNAIHMIQKRGYVVNHKIESESLESFLGTYGHDPDCKLLEVDVCTGIRVDDVTDKIGIFFLDDDRVGIANLKPLITIMQEKNIRTSIIIYKNKISPSVKQACLKFEPLYHIELFCQNELLVDITEHFMVPEHVAISEHDKQELLKKYSIHEEQLPRLRLDDPICKYYGFKRGQVIKITRHSETAGRSVGYRIVL